MGKRAILVLGMHRSGTSALTRIINLMGATGPRTLLPATSDNARGYWESAVLTELNEEILRVSGTGGDLPDGMRLDKALRLRRRGLGERLRELIASEFEGSELIVLKDPRVSRLVGLYEKALGDLGYEVCPVLALRNPAEVVASIIKRDKFDLRRTERLWLRYTLDSERATRHLPRGVASYDALMADWRGTIGKLGRQLGITWPVLSPEAEEEADSFMTSSLRHHTLPAPKHAENLRQRLVARVYQAMKQLETDPADSRARMEMTRAAMLFPFT